jgi:hypothetical protein
VPPRKGDLLMIATVKIDNNEYGTSAYFDRDKGKILISRITKFWQYQVYKTRNGREFVRRIRLSPTKNRELYKAVIRAFRAKYDA